MNLPALDFRVQTSQGSFTQLPPGEYSVCDPIALFGSRDLHADRRLVNAIYASGQGNHEGFVLTTEGLDSLIWAQKVAKTHNIRQVGLGIVPRHLGTIWTDSGLLALVPGGLARSRLQTACPDYIDTTQVTLSGFSGSWRLHITCIGGDVHVAGQLGLDVVTSGTPADD